MSAGMKAAMMARGAALARMRAERRRAAVAEALGDLGDVVIEGDAVRVSGRGLLRRWMGDLAVREAGRFRS